MLKTFLAGLIALAGMASPVRAELVVETRHVILKDFQLEAGAVLPELRIEYETCGTLAADGRNGVMMTHGYTSSQHSAGRYALGKAPPGLTETAKGPWEAMIGPGLPIDTGRYFIVSSNMLGSSYGTTGPASANPSTGKPYGPDFPEFSVVDMVRAQHALLEQLGVKHLVAVIGASYGGFQAFTWGVTYPEMMDGVVVAVSAPKGSGDLGAVDRLKAELARDPNWNGGNYYEKGGILPTLIDLRVATLKQYGIEASLMQRFPDPAARDAEIRRMAEPWARAFDGNSLVVLRRASVVYDAVPGLPRMKAKLLYALSRTDRLFPPSIAPGVMEKLRAAGVDARYVEIDSPNGHTGYAADAAAWRPALQAFMDGISPRS